MLNDLSTLDGKLIRWECQIKATFRMGVFAVRALMKNVPRIGEESSSSGAMAENKTARG